MKLLRLLKRRGVASVSYTTPFNATPLISVLVNWLVVLARPHQSERELTLTLSSPFAQVKPAYVAEVLNQQRDPKCSLYQHLLNVIDDGSLIFVI